MVADGGKVMVVRGTYNEAILIDKGLTLEAVGGESGPVVVAPLGTVNAAIQVATPDPVTIRGLTVQFTGVRGIFGTGVVDVTDRKSTRLNSSHEWISYAVFCLKKKKKN